MLHLFQQHIIKYFPKLTEAKLGVAISGGVDSVVLAHLCLRSGISISLLHCNFQLRGISSDGDQSFVKRLSEVWGVPFITTEFNTKGYIETHKTSVQLGARELRYKWFQKMSKLYYLDGIATAHHADDNLETFLINLSRGTGIEGLTGIPIVNGIYIRPLLPFSKETIITYAKENKLLWREDASNAETKYLRNKYRHTVIPAIKEAQPSVLNNFNTTIEYLQQTQALVKAYVSKFKNKHFKEEKAYNGYQINIEAIIKEPQSEILLFELFKEYGFTAWSDVSSLLKAQSGKKILSSTHILLKDRTHLILYVKKQEIKETFELTSNEAAIELSEKETLSILKVSKSEPNKNNNVVYLEAEKLEYPLIVRKKKDGDYFYPTGMLGKKKLSKYFKDEKFSIPQKNVTWLLCSGDNIVWVMGYRADKRFLIDEKSKTILKLEFITNSK